MLTFFFLLYTHYIFFSYTSHTTHHYHHIHTRSRTHTQVVETKSRAEYEGRMVDVITYCKHFDHLQEDPDINSDECEVSEYDEVKEWHEKSRVELSLREDLRPPNGWCLLSS